MEPEKRRVLSDKIVAVVLILLSIGMIVISYSFKKSRFDLPTSTAATFPRIVAIGMILFSVILFIQSAKREKKEKAAGADDYNVLLELKDEKLVIIMFGLVIAYLILIQVLGFMTATALFTFCSAYLLGRGKAKIWVMIAVAAGITVSAYVFFCVILKVIMPHGILI